MKEHVLITGGVGFLGHHLCEHLLRNTDWNITILDGLRHVGDPSRLADIECYDPARVTLHWWDLRSPLPTTVIERICFNGRPDYIVNLAADSHVDRSIQLPADTIFNNVALAVNMLDFARAIKTRSFIQFSTDEVFGPITAEHPQPFQEWERLLPSNPYSASKASQDMIAIAYWRTFQVPVVITHCMNLLGQRQDKSKFVPLCIDNLLQSKPVPVHGERGADGRWQAGTRFWLHARNCADAILFLLRHVKPAKYPDTDRPDKFNIAGEREISNLEIVHKVAAALGVEPRVEFVDAHSCRPGHDRAYGLASDKLRALGWRPPIDFDRSFRETILWEKQRLHS